MSEKISFVLNDFEGCKLLSLRGSISVSTIPSIEEIVYKTIDSNNLIIEMENVTLITSSGIGTLVELSQKAYAKGRRVVFSKLKKEFKDMFMILSLSHLLLFADSVQEAAMKIRYYT